MVKIDYSMKIYKIIIHRCYWPEYTDINYLDTEFYIFLNKALNFAYDKMKYYAKIIGEKEYEDNNINNIIPIFQIVMKSDILLIKIWSGRRD